MRQRLSEKIDSGKQQESGRYACNAQTGNGLIETGRAYRSIGSKQLSDYDQQQKRYDDCAVDNTNVANSLKRGEQMKWYSIPVHVSTVGIVAVVGKDIAGIVRLHAFDCYAALCPSISFCIQQKSRIVVEHHHRSGSRRKRRLAEPYHHDEQAVVILVQPQRPVRRPVVRLQRTFRYRLAKILQDWRCWQ